MEELMEQQDIQMLQQQVRQVAAPLQTVKSEMCRIISGQEALVERLLLALIANGHVLLEGVPGLAKTLAVKTLAGTLSGSFSRLQFTPDLLPADIIGTRIYNSQTGEFITRIGPVNANIVLADEINRAPAKVQSALLEAMQEKQLTVAGEAFALPDPFLVLATQNPIEQEGTYHLPEAQLDRFLFKVIVDYPSRDEELKVLEMMSSTSAAPSTNPVVTVEQIDASRQLMDRIFIDPAIERYIVDLVRATRNAGKLDRSLDGLVRAGASPRATINIAMAARALAFTRQRSYVTPQDVKDLAHDILRHRILLSYEAEAANVTSDNIIDQILSKVPVP